MPCSRLTPNPRTGGRVTRRSTECTLPASGRRDTSLLVMTLDRCRLVAFRRARVGAVLCLLVILFGPGQLFPGLLALGAALEGSHTVRVGSDGAVFHLVLSHERGGAGRPDGIPSHHPQHPAHHHGPAARILCLMAERTGVDPDHVANFATGLAWEHSQRAPGVEVNADDAELFQPAPAAATPSTMNAARCLPCLNHGPPGNRSLSYLLGSTVLLV